MDLNQDWQQLLLWASGLSLLVVIASIVGVPWLLTRLPSDYFARAERVAWRDPTSSASVIAILLGVLKNVLGLLLVVLGLVMLLTPGQGILTLLVGLLLMNFPGKYHLERWLVLRPGVLRGLNWLRRRKGQPPFEAPQQPSTAD
jgi:hypothetical protein